MLRSCYSTQRCIIIFYIQMYGGHVDNYGAWGDDVLLQWYGIKLHNYYSGFFCNWRYSQFLVTPHIRLISRTCFTLVYLDLCLPQNNKAFYVRNVTPFGDGLLEFNLLRNYHYGNWVTGKVIVITRIIPL